MTPSNASEAPRLTIIQFVEKYVGLYRDNTFLWEKKGKEWTSTTFRQTRDEACRIAAGLMSLGVQKGEKVSLLSEGRNLWVLGELGIRAMTWYSGSGTRIRNM